MEANREIGVEGSGRVTYILLTYLCLPLVFVFRFRRTRPWAKCLSSMWVIFLSFTTAPSITSQYARNTIQSESE